ncbi:MAG: glycosyltransferase family 2 protein [Candidatus Gracilibacteria bacterium]|nr:glycosyltransferase family 2 protein [Candidatus Gracilibacteria bacterium]MDD2908660.1 glycosyltransferase family 2 protein [Candidatus Gracilibacteria bacterium]
MKLSIITCTYNSEKYLQECIDSVISQNIDNEIYEHIFIDGFSTDGTKDIIEKYISDNPLNKIQFFQNSPKGVYNAMNEGIKKANGEYLLFLNSDDYLANNSLGEYLEFIKQTNNRDIYFGKVQFFNSNIPNIRVIPNYNLINRIAFSIFGFNSLVCHPGALVKKELFNKFGYFNENYKIMSDYEFWIKLKKNNIKFTYYDRLVTFFREHENSLSTTNRDIALIENNMIREMYYGKFLGKILSLFTKIIVKIIK